MLQRGNAVIMIDAAVRRGRRDDRRGVAPRHAPLLRAAGNDRARQARPLWRRAARQELIGQVRQCLRQCSGSTL